MASTIMFWLSIITAVLSYAVWLMGGVEGRVVSAKHGFAAAAFGLCASGVLWWLEADRWLSTQPAAPKLKPSDGLPYHSIFDDYDWTSFAIVFISLAVIAGAIIAVSLRARRYENDPVEPAVLASKLAAIDDADLRQRIATHLRRKSTGGPITEEAFDNFAQQARDE